MLLKCWSDRQLAKYRVGYQATRAFIGVYPPGKRLKKWLVRRFSIPEGLVHEYFGEKDIVDDQKIDLESLEAVEELLRGWSIDASLFDTPWKSDYPL